MIRARRAKPFPAAGRDVGPSRHLASSRGVAGRKPDGWIRSADGQGAADFVPPDQKAATPPRLSAWPVTSSAAPGQGRDDGVGAVALACGLVIWYVGAPVRSSVAGIGAGQVGCGGNPHRGHPVRRRRPPTHGRGCSRRLSLATLTFARVNDIFEALGNMRGAYHALSCAGTSDAAQAPPLESSPGASGRCLPGGRPRRAESEATPGADPVPAAPPLRPHPATSGAWPPGAGSGHGGVGAISGRDPLGREA